MCWLRWAPAPFLFAFGWFLFLFACFLRGSIRISDRGKCISTHGRWVGCCSLPPLVVQFTRFSHLLLLLFYSHLQDRAIELNRPTPEEKKSIDPAVWDNYPKALMKKDSLSCSSCHLDAWHHFTFLSSRFAISFERHSVHVYGRVSRFYATPVWASRFYRSLCYVVCVHGLLSLE